MLTGEAKYSYPVPSYCFIIFIGGNKMNTMIYNKEIYAETPIKDYYISCDGKIYSKKVNRIMKTFQTRFGHLRIELKDNGVPKKFCVHRLVYATWVGDLIDGMVIEHLDNDPTNNHYTNLKQSTQKENVHTCINANRRVYKTKNPILLNVEENKYYKFNSVAELMTFFGLKGDSLTKFKRSTSRMLEWKIIDNETIEGQSTIETINFGEAKLKNGVEYFVGEIPIEEVRSI